MDVLSQTFLYDRILAGVDVHPSQPELIEFERLSENKTKLDDLQKNIRNKAKSE